MLLHFHLTLDDAFGETFQLSVAIFEIKFLLRQLLAGVLNVFAILANAAFQLTATFGIEGDTALCRAELVAMLVELLTQFRELSLEAPGHRTSLGDEFLLGGHLLLDLGFLDVERFDRGLEFTEFRGEFEKFFVAQMSVEHFDIDRKRLVAARLGDLATERIHASLLLSQYIAHAQQIRFGIFQLAQCFAFFTLILGNARSFFEYRTSFFGLGRENLIDLPLRHDRISCAANARVHKQVMDVLQSAKRVVDAILRFAIAIDPTCDRYLVVINFQRRFAIGHRQGDLCHPLRLALFGAIENDVRHLTAAQRLG